MRDFCHFIFSLSLRCGKSKAMHVKWNNKQLIFYSCLYTDHLDFSNTLTIIFLEGKINWYQLSFRKSDLILYIPSPTERFTYFAGGNSISAYTLPPAVFQHVCSNFIKLSLSPTFNCCVFLHFCVAIKTFFYECRIKIFLCKNNKRIYIYHWFFVSFNVREQRVNYRILPSDWSMSLYYIYISHPNYVFQQFFVFP